MANVSSFYIPGINCLDRTYAYYSRDRLSSMMLWYSIDTGILDVGIVARHTRLELIRVFAHWIQFIA